MDLAVAEIKASHGGVGQIIVQGHLRARGIHVQCYRIRASLARVDPDGVHIVQCIQSDEGLIM